VPVSLEAEIEQGQREGRLHHLLGRFKAFTHRHPVLRLVYKGLVTLVGGAIVLAGVVMLVTPGPGWLAIFLGLGVLATEYPLVHRFNQWAKGKVVGVWRAYRRRREQRRELKTRVRAERAGARVARRQRHDLLSARFHSRHSCAPHRRRGAHPLVLPRTGRIMSHS
jgi:uncharacterized protein (TIGR02611 family)